MFQEGVECRSGFGDCQCSKQHNELFHSNGFVEFNVDQCDYWSTGNYWKFTFAYGLSVFDFEELEFIQVLRTLPAQTGGRHP